MEEEQDQDLWNYELNEVLYNSVIERTFDFSLIAIDIRDHIIRAGLDKDFDLYTNEQCRMQWNKIHTLREEAIEREEEDFEDEPEPPEEKKDVGDTANPPKIEEPRESLSITGKIIVPSSYDITKNSLEPLNKQLDSQMSEMLKYIIGQDKLIEELEEESDELMDYRYIRKPDGEIIVMSKPFSKLTAKEMRDTENMMTSEPFDEKDPDVKIHHLKNPEKLPKFSVSEKEEIMTSDSKPEEKTIMEEKKIILEESKETPVKDIKSMEDIMRESGWKPSDVYKMFDPILPEPKTKKYKVKRKKAVWEMLDDILTADKSTLERGGMDEFVEEEKEEDDEDEKLKLEEQKREQRILDMRIAEAVNKIIAKKEKEQKEKDKEQKLVAQKEKEEQERILNEKKEQEEMRKKKQEELARKLKEEEIQRKEQEEKLKAEQEKKMKIEQEKQELKQTETRIFEDAKNSTLLYDRSLCLNKQETSYLLPMKLINGQVTFEEKTLMRYQSLVLPIFDSTVIYTKILPYFLLNSSINFEHIECERKDYPFFCYHCIGCMTTILSPPLNNL